MKKINSYIFKELLLIFIIANGTLTGALFLDKLLHLTEIIVNKGISFITVAKMIVYLSPAFLVLTIPMSVLIASVVTYSRLSADSEIIALKAGGYSFPQLLTPVMLLSILTYIVTGLLMAHALPNGNQAFRELIFQVLRSEANYEIKPKLFNNDFKKMIIYVNEKDPKSSIMKGVFISETTENGDNRVINASEGVILSDKKSFIIQLLLKDGTIHRLEKSKKSYQTLKFEQYTLEIEIPKSEKIVGQLKRGNRELNIPMLREKIAQLKKEGLPFKSVEVELYKKFSIPFTCLIMGLIGTPLGIKLSRSGKSGSFAISLIVIVFYYILLLTGQSMGNSGKLHPFLAMWVPNFIIILIAGYLSYKTAYERPFKFCQYIFDNLLILLEKVKHLLFADINFQKDRSLNRTRN